MNTHSAFAVALALVGALASLPAHAQQPRGTTQGHTVPVPSITPVRRTTPIALDGRLDEASWAAAPIATDFRQIDPVEGAPATQRTLVRFLTDDEALYVGVKLFDTEGRKGVRPQLARRDKAYDADWFEIALDTYHDHVRRVFMSVTPSGAKNDETGVGSSCCDPGWDPVWEAATQIDDDGWSAELRIPFNQLRMPTDSLQTWGLQLKRVASRSNETSLWAFWRRDEPGGAPRYGHLENLVVPVQPRHLEILPYVVTSYKDTAVTAGDPFRSDRRSHQRIGADLKYLVTPNLALSATINPDFGQVEADPNQINLSAFETFFAEKRPFFIEGGGAFRFGRTLCFFCSNFSSIESFYSRRIGRAPAAAGLARGAGPFANIPDASAILGAAKLTGRTSSGIALGVLNAVTRREDAHVRLANGQDTAMTVEPLANYFVARATSDHRAGNVVTGVFASSVARDVTRGLEPFFNRHAEMLGADVEAYWGKRRYSFLASGMVSSIAGDSLAIAARQRSSARYYQRPDDSRSVVPSATSMRGAGGYMRLARDVGSWTWEGAVNTRTPGFEVNDVAFQSRADYIWFLGNVARFFNTPTKYYRRVYFVAGAQYQRNYQGLGVVGQQQHVSMNITTPQFWNVGAFAIRRPSTLDDRLLRGGPSARVPAARTWQIGVSSDPRKPISGNVSMNRQTTDRNERFSFQSVSLTTRPRSNYILSIAPSLSRQKGALQYVATRSDPTATAFSGARYVFADLDQTVLSTEIRSSVTITPTLSFDVYAQPLMSSASYTNFEEFDAPRSGTLRVYGRDAGTITPVYAAGDPGRVATYTIDPDATGPAASFSVANPNSSTQSLRGNAVLRWEYRPGSTLFVAWTQSRAGGSYDGAFDVRNSSDALFTTRPDNIFLVKVSWWWAQ